MLVLTILLIHLCLWTTLPFILPKCVSALQGTHQTNPFLLFENKSAKAHLSLPPSPSCSSLSCLQSTAHLAMYPLSLPTLSSPMDLFQWAVWTGRLTGSKHRTFGLCHTGVNWNCPPLLRLFSCCPEEEEEEEGLSLSLTVSNCRLWQRAVSIQAALLLRPPSAHVLPTSSGKLRPGSVAHHPSLLRPLNPNSKSNSMHFCHSRHK